MFELHTQQIRNYLVAARVVDIVLQLDTDELFYQVQWDLYYFGDQ